MCICIARYGMKVLYRCYKLPGYGSKCHERDDGNHCMKCKYAKAEMSASDATRLISSYDIQPEIIRCKDCKHKPYPSDNYDYDNGDCGFEIIFPDYRCPCRCDDEYYNHIPDDDWFCGNAERREDV